MVSERTVGSARRILRIARVLLFPAVVVVVFVVVLPRIAHLGQVWRDFSRNTCHRKFRMLDRLSSLR